MDVYSKKIAAVKTGQATGLTAIATLIGFAVAKKYGMDPVIVIPAVGAALGYIADALSFWVKKAAG